MVATEPPPRWRRVVTAAEETAAPRVEALVRSEAFAEVVGVVARAQATVRRGASRATRRLLHAANLPAGTDMTRILTEIGRLQQQLGDLQRHLDEQDD